MSSPPRSGVRGWRGPLSGLGAAVLFGLSAPASKLLLPFVHPLMLAALLYLGSAVGLWTVAAVRGVWRRSRRTSPERFSRRDWPLVLMVSLLGGVVGPVLLLSGLSRVSGISGSLLLNLEGPLTALLAVTFFGEHLSLRAAIASLGVFGAAALVSVETGSGSSGWPGALAVAAACASWAIDNNLTQRLSLKDPVTLVGTKAAIAGSCSLALAFAAHDALPAFRIAAFSLLLGAVSYGASIVLDVLALRWLGAAREAAFFAIAPFVGAIASVPLLGEHWSARMLAAAAIMTTGVALLIRERHRHVHSHGEVTHSHSHRHDSHHQHAHEGPVTEPHVHEHHHSSLVHDHPHVSDAHHRHSHS